MSYFDRAAQVIKQFEGLRLHSYICPAGKLTVAYGHTGNDVRPNTVVTEDQADALLLADMVEADSCITDKVKVALNENQRAAIISFVFNLGCWAFSQSSLLRFINAGEFASAAAELPKWCHAGGMVLPGLVKRRAAERKLFEEAVDET